MGSHKGHTRVEDILRYVARLMGYDCMVLVKDDTINSVEVFLELVIHLEGLWELMLEFGEARL